MDISNLYPNLLRQTDRRKQNSPVENDQRSGRDRRINDNTIFPLQQNQRTLAPYIDPKLDKDLKDIKTLLSTVDRYDKASKTKETEKDAACGLLCSIPYFRRAEGIYESAKDHETLETVGKIGLLAINIPTDTGDIKAAAHQVMGKTTSTGLTHAFQEKFSFFRGTLLEPVLKKLLNSDSEKLGKLGNYLYDIDGTLYDTQFGQKLLDKLGCTERIFKETSKLDAMGLPVYAVKIEGKFLARLVGRAMLRVPLLGLAALAAFEIPSILRAFTKKDNLKDNAINGTKETIKSGVSILGLTTGGALLGGALASIGPVGSLVGLGTGSYIGSESSKKINEKIDNII